MSKARPVSTKPRRERAILVGVDMGRSDWTIEESMDELARLAETDGAEVVMRVTQRLEKPVPRTFIGSGKAQELVTYVHNLEADVVIFDDELTPSQQSNLERILGEPTKVIDRTALILDIFGEHATTREGRLQVQLAQLQYLLPRLRGMWSHLVGEQTRGGIGSRFGQGESQLEVDRRLVRDRISQLRHDLDRLDTQRATQSKARWDSGVYRVSLVGYTNAGKSTLLNRMTGANAYVQDELFATLDPTTRSLDLEEGRKITLTDTVGFIQKLPTTLVESFKSTLAEVEASDLILRVVDASDRNASKELDAVDEVLDQIGARDIDTLTVYNKCDLITPEERLAIERSNKECVCISALEGTGIRELMYRIAEHASRGDVTITACIPYEKGLLMRMVHERCQVIRETYDQRGLVCTIKASKRMADMLKPYQEDETQENKPAEQAD